MPLHIVDDVRTELGYTRRLELSEPAPHTELLRHEGRAGEPADCAWIRPDQRETDEQILGHAYIEWPDGRLTEGRFVYEKATGGWSVF